MSELVPLSKLDAQTEALRAQWSLARPFAHAVIDDFLSDAACETLRGALRARDGWIENRHLSQRLRSRNTLAAVGPEVGAVIDALDAPAMRRWVSAVTGIEGLFLDREMTDGGLAVMSRGDFFDLHTDMQSHAFERRWRRRVNLIVYLSERWDPRWGGALELWDPQGRACVSRVFPSPNRAVLFEVSREALHGVPEPLRCPPDAARSNLVLYYYSAERDPVPITHFRYRARPGEHLRRPAVALNNAALSVYQALRGRVGDLDPLVSRWMKRR